MNLSKFKFGILTSGGDCPGLNAAIRGVVKAAMNKGITNIVGIAEGYRGLIEGRTRDLSGEDFTDLLTRGGTILGSSREKPFAKDENFKSDAEFGKAKPDLIKQNYKKLGLDCLVVLGGNGTQTTASLLQNSGINVIGLPKTIDNDLWGTEPSFGFHSAVRVATEAIDRLHTTAHSHGRVMVIELMGHKAGWLSLYAGIGAGGDVLLIPEIPYDAIEVADYLKKRAATGKHYAIVVVAEGAMSKGEASMEKKDRKKMRAQMSFTSIGYRVAAEIAQNTDMETRVTVIGYLQRGGVPSAYDRVLATSFGVRAAALMAEGNYGKMVAAIDGKIGTIALSEVAGKTKRIPLDHELLTTARDVGTYLGSDEI